MARSSRLKGRREFSVRLLSQRPAFWRLSDLSYGHRPEPVPPKPQCLVRDVDPAFVELVLDVAKNQP